MNQIKTFRKLAIVVLVLASVLTLAACNKGEKTPYGDISDNNVYLEFGDVTITERELYNQLRMQGAPILATMVDEHIFSEEITTVRALLQSGDEDATKYLDDTINGALHGITDWDQLEDFYTKYPDRFDRNIEQFVDSLYLLDNTVDITSVTLAIKNLVNTEENAYSGYASIASIVSRYELRLAQRHYAKGDLAVEVLDEDASAYISDADVVTYYKNNEEGRYPVESLVIRFINLNEANAALYKASIKSDSKGLWYEIPDIRIRSTDPGVFVDLGDLVQYGHVRSILENLELLDKINDVDQDRGLTVTDYENYYKSYVISTTRDNGNRDQVMSTDEVKASFVRIYNFLNPANEIEIDVDGNIVGSLGSEFSTTYTYDDLTKLNTSLRTHVYTTLSSADTVDPEDPAAAKPYSSRVQTFGNSRYLVFKLSDDKSTEEDILIEDPSDENAQIFGSSTEAQNKKNEMFTEFQESKLTNTYIQTKVNSLYTELDLDIYDGVLRSFYKQSYTYDGTNKNTDGDVVASIDGHNITVRQFYTRLEKTYGINLALDMASNKYLITLPDYSISSDDKKDYDEQFKEIIQQFSADQFASAGFPASMGREQFLLLAFGATSIDDAVNQLYVYPNLRQQYLDNIEAHYGEPGYSIYEKFADLAELHFDNFKSINVSHLLIYFDENGDGTPDNPTEYLDKLSTDGQEDTLEKLVELVQLVYTRVGNYRGHVEGLNALASEFNNSGRIFRGENKIPPYDYTLEQIWSEFRQFGFYLKFEAISTPITNTSNFITGSSVLDEVFYNRAMEIHETVSEMAEGSKFPYLDLFETVITEVALNDVKSSFGWHLILATSVTDTRSAEYSASLDSDDRYVSSDGTLTPYNEDSETLIAGQIEYFIKESKTDEGVSLPTVVQTAITNYLQPILDRYSSTYMQRELVFKLMEDVEFTNTVSNDRFLIIRGINRNQMNEYVLSPTGYFDSNYENLYATWFDVLESTTP
ncbi:MAG: hypothetical protein IH571_02655 [Acholeplasmataceae bacterium]|nr:hypothetical protein [Acholeplasmataceae bacterium]